MNWGRITEKAHRVAVIGTGKSAEDLDWNELRKLHRDGLHVIITNDAYHWCPVWDTFITLDVGSKIRPILDVGPENYPDRGFYAAVPDTFGTRFAPSRTHTSPLASNVTLLARMRVCEGLSDDPRAIASGNSLWAALQAAYLMGASRIGLFGLDGNGVGYAYGTGAGPAGDHSHLPDLFASALPQLQGKLVVNGSSSSRVTCFPRMEAGHALKHLLD